LTSDTIQEKLVKVIKMKYQGDKSCIYQLGQQSTLGLMDFNAETHDLNRRKEESITQYLSRVLQNDSLSESNCVGMADMIPAKFQKYNGEMKTYSHTYYFAHATGERKRLREKAREVLKEPKRMLDNACGFDINLTQGLKYRNSKS